MNFADAIILAYTSPIWVVALAPLLIREKTRWQQWGGGVDRFRRCSVRHQTGGRQSALGSGYPARGCVDGRPCAISSPGISRRGNRRCRSWPVPTCFIDPRRGGNATARLGATARQPRSAQLIAAGVFFTVAQMLMVESFRLMEATVLSTFKYSSILYAAVFRVFVLG